LLQRHLGSHRFRADVASERFEATRQFCERVYDLEQDLKRLQLSIAHLDDEQLFDLTYEDLTAYGFQ
jgi:predicted HD phosphohydrolase